MLRGNLSTRPFYNQRLVTLAIVVAALVALGLAAFNVQQIMSLSSQIASFKANEQRDSNEATRIRTEAATLTKTVDQSKLRYLAAATREANTLIDQRTFSWTSFFGHVEKMLPLDARLLSVSPRVEKGEFRIAMVVVGRQPSAIKEFQDNLMATGVFYDVATDSRARNDDGTHTATVSGTYFVNATPPGSKLAPAAGRKGRP